MVVTFTLNLYERDTHRFIGTLISGIPSFASAQRLREGHMFDVDGPHYIVISAAGAPGEASVAAEPPANIR
jgi:hypothetical protein